MNYVIITLLLISVAFFIWAARRQTFPLKYSGKKVLSIIVYLLVLLIEYNVFASGQDKHDGQDKYGGSSAIENFKYNNQSTTGGTTTGSGSDDNDKTSQEKKKNK